MDRRTVLASGGVALITGLSGCLSFIRAGDSDSVSAELEKVDDVDIRVNEPPEATEANASNGFVTIEGSIAYGSKDCATPEIGYAKYESYHNRLDLLVIATEDPDAPSDCDEVLSETGYRLNATVDDTFYYVAVTEHHAQGGTYSTTFNLR